MTPAERAAYERGREAGAKEMREAAAKECERYAQAHQDAGLTHGDKLLAMRAAAAHIRSLPLPTPAEPEVVEPRAGMVYAAKVQGCKGMQVGRVGFIDVTGRAVGIGVESDGNHIEWTWGRKEWSDAIRSGRLVILDDGGSK